LGLVDSICDVQHVSQEENNSPYLALGALVLVVTFFYNEEKFPLPLNNSLFGESFAFVVSLFSGTGLVVEWLLEKPH
jgi:predicted permease